MAPTTSPPSRNRVPLPSAARILMPQVRPARPGTWTGRASENAARPPASFMVLGPWVVESLRDHGRNSVRRRGGTRVTARCRRASRQPTTEASSMHRPRRHSLSCALFLLLLAAVTTVAHAIGQGRLIGTVVDGAGTPVPGVKVVITSPDMGTFRLEKTSDA